MKKLFIIVIMILLSSYTYKVVFDKSNSGGLKLKDKEELVFVSKKKKKRIINKKRKV
jgi:hypothetical protein